MSFSFNLCYYPLPFGEAGRGLYSTPPSSQISVVAHASEQSSSSTWVSVSSSMRISWRSMQSVRRTSSSLALMRPCTSFLNTRFRVVLVLVLRLHSENTPFVSLTNLMVPVRALPIGASSRTSIIICLICLEFFLRAAKEAKREGTYNIENSIRYASKLKYLT